MSNTASDRKHVSDEPNIQPHGSRLVLVGAVSLALGLWSLWLFIGIEVVHSRVSAYAKNYAVTSTEVSKAAKSNEGNSPPSLDRAAVMAEVGQAGDAFGGANALFAALAGALVLWAGVLQSRALKEAQRATKLATQAYDDERTANRREHFASIFFQMLTLSRQLVERINTPAGDDSASDDERRHGAAALENFAWNLISRLEAAGAQQQPARDQACAIATTYIGTVYNRQPSSLGPYFRLLFQTFKFVADADLEEDEKIRFANIARGQISEGAVMLLAANGLTERGHRFVPLIERFGLLEHLHNSYRDKYKAALLEGYRRRAFLGSKEREKHPWIAEPLRPAHYFINWPAAMDEERDAEQSSAAADR